MEKTKRLRRWRVVKAPLGKWGESLLSGPQEPSESGRGIKEIKYAREISFQWFKL